MAKFSVSNFKAAGIYTIEIDNTQRSIETSDSLRLVVGFNNKGPFNRPILLEKDVDRLSIFGDIDNKLENKGCYFNRMLRTSLATGPVIALNLLNVDKSLNGPDLVNYAALSLDAGASNPSVNITKAIYGEYDYNAELSGTNDERPNIQYVGNTPFASLYDRSRFWVADKDLLTAAAAQGLGATNNGSGTYEYSNLLNFANIGTDEISILVFKPDSMPGYEITAEKWYNGKENIPFGWIRPYDYISDYFLQVVCIKGNWTNYPILSTDPVWKSYFDKNGVIKSRLNKFLSSEGIVVLGQWTGCIIPDFINNQGANLSLEKMVNSLSERTGLLMSFNEDAANLLNYDYSGSNLDANEAAKGQWGIDIDGNNEIEGGEAIAKYLVDMVGHNINVSTYFSSKTETTSLLTSKKEIIDSSSWTASAPAGSIFKFKAKGDLSTIEVTAKSGANVETLTLNTDEENYLYANIVKDSSITVSATSKVTLLNAYTEQEVVESKSGTRQTVDFLSYNIPADNFVKTISSVYYFNDPTLYDSSIADNIPVPASTMNMFIITDNKQWLDENIKVGDYVQNKTYNNGDGEAQKYNLIPGITRVIKKRFIQVINGCITYNGVVYKLKNSDLGSIATNGNKGFYLIETAASVLVDNNKIVRQLALTDSEVNKSLHFIPMKGLTLTSKHRPGYDANGNLNIEQGIDKVYSMLMDEGIKRGLLNREMVDYRYIIDSMSYGLREHLGGKYYLSKLAKDRGKCLAILNLPSAKQFAVSSNPYFCNTFVANSEIRPGLNTKYIAEGGNTEMGATNVFSLPTEEDGSQFTACFFPHLLYRENGKIFPVPPAADVANVLARKFTGVSDPYCICANYNGILLNKYLYGLDFLADTLDREYLEPMGVNTIIKDGSSIMIYGNLTAYQDVKSDLNKLHVRENLNTAEIECEKVIKKFNFLYNTPAMRAAVVQQLTPILQAMQIAGAIVKYDIICNETNNTDEMIENDFGLVDVHLWVNHGMEKIIQSFILNRLGAE